MMINDHNIIKLIISHSHPKLIFRQLSKSYRDYIDTHYKFVINKYPLFDNIYDKYKVDKISIDTTILENPIYFNNLVKYLNKHDTINIYVLTIRMELLNSLFEKIEQYCKINLIFPVGFNDDINLLAHRTNINGIVLLERYYTKKIYKLPPNLNFFFSIYYNPRNILTTSAIHSNIKLLSEYPVNTPLSVPIRGGSRRCIDEYYKDASNKYIPIKSGYFISINTSDNDHEDIYLTDDEFHVDIIYILNNIIKKYT